MTRIQYISDLHLEFYKSVVFDGFLRPVAPYLVLAGDIGQPGHPVFEAFLAYVSQGWEHVFYVAGNHEAYKGKASGLRTPDETRRALQASIAPFSNIHFLSAEVPLYVLEKEKVVFAGLSLWSHIPDEWRGEAVRGVNDYKQIGWKDEKGDVRLLMPADMNTMHAHEKRVLREALIDAELRAKSMEGGGKIVVVTHYLPSYSLISPRYSDSPLNCCFASECLDLLQPSVRAWIYGHTHTASRHEKEGVVFCANPLGYPGETDSGVDVGACLEI
jgi:predicted phosphodiesterase